MPKNQVSHRGLVLCLLAAGGVVWTGNAVSSIPPSRHDDRWLGTGPAPGFNGEVLAAVGFEGDLVVGGLFAVAGSVPLNQVGRWDGAAWHPLGDGVNGPVTRLYPFQGGLVASGFFNVAGADSAEGVAFWQDGAWSAMGAGLSSPPATFTTHENRLVAGGGGSAGHYPARAAPEVAAWDGTTWQPLGRGEDGTGLPNPARALVSYHGDLLAGGWFRFPSGSGAESYGLARWDGTRWNPAGPLLERSRYRNVGFNAFTTYNGLLVAGGLFDLGTYEGGRPPGPVEVAAGNVMTFDGETWAPLGEGFNGGVISLTVQQGVLVAAGFFTRSGTQVLNHLAWWDEATQIWQPLGAGTDGLVRDLAPVGDVLFAGGKFKHAGGLASPYLAAWKDQAWTALPAEPPAFTIEPIHSLVDYHGTLVGYGYDLVTWRDGVWSRPPGSRVPDPLPLAYKLDTDWGDWYLDFRLGLDPQGRVVTQYDTWDGGTLAALPRFKHNPQVMRTFEGKLVAGGFFDEPWGAYAVQILEGDAWQRMDAGLLSRGVVVSTYPRNIVYDSRIRALEVVNGSPGLADGTLIAGGAFQVDDGLAATNLAAWDGSRWVSFAPGTNSVVEAFAVYDGDLVAAGNFTEAGGIPAACIARWDGSEWHPLGTGLDGPVHDLALYNGRLIAGGLFQRAGPWTVRNVAAWDGTGWSPLGSGTDGEVDALAVHEGDLFLGGRFIAAGGRTSIHFARWSDGSPVPEFDELTATRVAEGARVRWNATAVPGNLRGFALYRDAFGKEPDRISSELLNTSGELLDRNVPAGPVTYRMATEAYSGKINMVAATNLPAEPGLVLRLDPARPNPFQGSTRIAFTSGVEGRVRLTVVDVSGRVVEVVIDRTQPPGGFEVAWDGTDAAGRRAAGGLYFLRLTTPEGVRAVKVQKLP